jgi:hypothetical protein
VSSTRTEICCSSEDQFWLELFVFGVVINLKVLHRFQPEFPRQWRFENKTTIAAACI